MTITITNEFFIEKTISKFSSKLYNILEEINEKTGFDEHRIIYLGIYGSQNYLMDGPESDIDCECFIFPSKDDIIFAKSLYSTCINTTYGTCHIKDIRMAFNELIKSSPNILEVFATPYALINHEYIYTFRTIDNFISYFATLNPYRLMRGLEGLMKRYEKDLENPKYFANYVRMLTMIEGVLNGDSYKKLITPKIHEYLKELKYLDKINKDTLETVSLTSDFKKIEMEDFFNNIKPESNESVLNSIKFYQSELMTKYIKLEF